MKFAHWRPLWQSSVSLPRWQQTGLDLAVSAFAWYAAYMLRFDGLIPDQYRAQWAALLPWMLAVHFLARFPLGVHFHIWRLVSIREARDIVLSLSAATVVLWLFARLVLGAHIPMGVVVLHWGLATMGYLAVRAFRRLFAEWHPQGTGHKNILLVGAGQAGLQLAREIRLQQTYRAVGFVDDNPLKRGSRLHGIEVLGGTADIPALVATLGVEEVIIGIPSATPAQMREILAQCQEARVATKTLPGLGDLLSGHVELKAVRAVHIEDLLGRAPVRLDAAAAQAYVGGRTVLVTGGGGSIGAELCRQLAMLGPARLLVLGRGEHSVYVIEHELRRRFPELVLVPVIADVRDERRMRQIFERFKPQVVFHAAAHKHVPLMEQNAPEAVWNNVRGTQVVASLADAYGAETFVLVSTDKAVNPTNVMGASKRVAELVVRELSARSKTRFMAVRFGNVLDSRGSVIPLFKQQIAAGGPITITHPEITRFFMTIPEASQLVIQAGALGQGGEVFVLDMGEPVKIVDLARDLIRLSGFEPEVDIPLRFTGLRPGEKLYEELLTAEEGTAATRFQKIFTARPEAVDPSVLAEGLQQLYAAAEVGEDALVRDALRTLVPTYREPASGSAPLEHPSSPRPMAGSP